MSLAAKLLSASGGAVDKLYVDEVFQAFTRTGTGADVTVTTGIDMTKGYMLWSKGRSGATDHAIYDSARGVTLELASNTTAAQTTQATGLKSVSATGHTVGSLAKMNTSAATYVDFVFRKAAKFFDVVTFTTIASANQRIPHSLGSAPGLIIIKNLGVASNWHVYHRSNTISEHLSLNATAAKSSSANFWGTSDPTATDFGWNSSGFAAPGSQYVAYLFAHDASADGIVQCGSFTTDASGNATVNLGWEPQYVMFKRSDGISDWSILDDTRTFTADAGYGALYANLSSAESAQTGYIRKRSTGFTVNAAFGAAVVTGVYLAIRRPNKPPTTGTQVYNAIARTGTGAAATVTGVGFAPDLVMSAHRAGSATHFGAYDRLRGANNLLITSSTGIANTSAASVTSFDMSGISVGADGGYGCINYYVAPYINHFFKRAVGVFDEVCFTGTPSAVPHSLGVIPELMIQKKRGVTSDWYVTYGPPASASNAILQSTAAGTAFGNISASQTSTTFYSIWGMDSVVAYLFATKAGISKVGSYTGNGSSLTLNMGFTTGARFFMVKRTDSTGDWFVFDTTRGIIAGNDGHLSLNTTAAEVTSNDSVDPDTTGLVVNQVAATNINVTSATYIYLAFA